MGMGDIVLSLTWTMTNAGALADRYLFQHKGGTFGAGAMEQTNIVTNPEALVSLPTSWRQLFEDDSQGQNRPDRSRDGGMIEVVAKTYFDGNETLNTRAGSEQS